MKFYKAPQNTVHCLESELFEHLLPEGSVEITKQQADELSVTHLTQDQVVASYESALDQHLDSVAQAHRFKDRHSLALRAGYPSAYQALGSAFATWMDGCNVQAYQRLQRVIAGEEQMPTIEAFINDLPEFVAP